MRRLPSRRLEGFTRERVRVSRESTIRVRHNTYSVDSRLMKEWVEVRIFADHLAVWYGQRKMEELPEMAESVKMYHVEDELFPRDAQGRKIAGKGLSFSGLEIRLPQLFLALYLLLGLGLLGAVGLELLQWIVWVLF